MVWISSSVQPTPTQHRKGRANYVSSVAVMFVSMRENLIIQHDNLDAAYVVKLLNLNLKLKFK